MNLSALQTFMIELLRDIISDFPIVDVFNNNLTEPSKKRIFADHLIKNLIRPAFIMLMYLRDERDLLCFTLLST